MQENEETSEKKSKSFDPKLIKPFLDEIAIDDLELYLLEGPKAIEINLDDDGCFYIVSDEEIKDEYSCSESSETSSSFSIESEKNFESKLDEQTFKLEKLNIKKDSIKSFEKINIKEDSIKSFEKINIKEDSIKSFEKFNIKEDSIKSFEKFNIKEDSIKSFEKFNIKEDDKKTFEKDKLNIKEDSKNSINEENNSEKTENTNKSDTKSLKKDFLNKKYAHIIPSDYVPKFTSTLEFPFKLDIFQIQSFYFLTKSTSIFVSAHTSSGKTSILHYCIHLCSINKTRVIYTSPIKALSNQKYNELKEYNPGIITGDISLNKDSNVLIVTTEILRNLLYTRSPLINNLEYVVFDEVHYVSDRERGVVWEECIIMMPGYVTVAMLSACIQNDFEFAEWVGRIRDSKVCVIRTEKRAVPLEYFKCEDEDVKKIFENQSDSKTIKKENTIDKKTFYKDENIFKKETTIKNENNINKKMSLNDENTFKKETTIKNENAYKKEFFIKNENIDKNENFVKNTYNKEITAKKEYTVKKEINIKKKLPSMTSIQRGNYKYKTDSIVFLSNYIIKKNLFPSIFFCFSKKKCHDHANKILKQFLNENEKKEVLKIIQEKLSKLNAYKNLPQVVEITKLLINGIAIHHSGLLSFLKELVEILFSKGLIKIIIATETFSVGVNFPAKSVVFLKLKKMSDDGMRLLNSGEFMQMSGRAGRRGKDKKGIVIINSNDSKKIISLINGKSFLESKFRLNFSMILRMLRIKIKVEDVLRKSFGEEKMQKNGFKEVKKLSKLEKIYTSLLSDLKNNIGEDFETKNISVINCKICNDIKEYIQKYKEFYKANNKLIKKYLNKKNYKNFSYILKNSKEFYPKNIEHNKIFGKETKTIFESKLYNEIINERIIDYVYFNDENNENIDISFSEILGLKKENEYFFDYNFENYKDKLEKLHVKKLFLDLNEYICIKCPDFKIHYNQMLKITILKEEIEKIKFCLSDSNLNLIKEYYEKIYFLIQNEYIDEDLNLLVKGRIACEIRSVDEIFMTELVSRNLIKKMKNEDFLGFVSGFINFEIIDEENEISKNLINYVLNEFSCKVNDKQDINYNLMDQKCFIGYYEFKFGNLYFNAIKDWCLGKKFCEIVILHKVSEGTIVKIVMRLIEFLKEMQNVCTFVNDSELHNKIEECLNCLERDIVSSASLYFDQ